ncbi:MAG: response regulator transcription factor [Proteobacteria bacterium]|nr:MAG: response regulator transcription factor [Pseudomonadota bacterium]
MDAQKILIIEDHNETRRFLETMLSQKYQVLVAENAVVGIDHARHRAPDLIILDVVLPILNGIDACSLLKQDEKTKRIPIILLSVKHSQAEVAKGLAAGADDFLPKPFDFKELETRIATRLKKVESTIARPLVIGELKIDPTTRDVTYGGKRVQLTLTEFDILKFIVSKQGMIVSRDEILKEVWKDQSHTTNDRTIDVHIRALRKKIPDMTRHIISIYGVGYKYEE